MVLSKDRLWKALTEPVHKDCSNCDGWEARVDPSPTYVGYPRCREFKKCYWPASPEHMKYWEYNGNK